MREFRMKYKFSNFMKDLRVEQYKVIYDVLMTMDSIYPKSLAMKEPPKRYRETDSVFAKVVDKLMDLGIWAKPEG